MLSVCMIVKDEEALLADCLDSIKAIADEILVVDTGSRDKTIEIAESAGARVIATGWEDDFSAARNCALQQAEGNWIFVIDADERLAPEDHETLKNCIWSADVDVFTVKIINEDGTKNLLPRLFRNGLGIQYRDRIHEQPVTESGARISRVADSGIRLYHVGYSPNLPSRHDRIDRNLALIQRLQEASPEDRTVRKHQAYTLQYAGQYEAARQVWDALIPYVSREALDEVLKNRAICIFESASPQEAGPALEEAIRAFPEEPALHVRLAQVYQVKGDMSGLRREIRILTRLDPENRHLRTVRAILYFWEENYYLAGAEFAKLMVDYPDDPSSYVNLAQVLILSDDLYEAVATLEEGMRRLGPVDDFIRVLLSVKVNEDSGLKARLKKLFDQFPILRS